ncbi:hypothetical protein FVA74_06990 [Salinibacterium sp. dk2585]|uniref:hypothetical protein n=1 Tax=unclassified Salinibacterium TaxID=2632331 RepID=UPI0011C24DE1|nr:MULTISPECIES: hypothetical protein [unclassified Salinibacterium]QEE61352.1 hypothetical protein FVA74_06990 [Salinibacterium sp. dk2585]TXK54029.1 hypothetical protein FVP63_08440 [Salinibacterium sp. dk5596]
MARNETVKPGDGHTLSNYRWWQLFSRSLLHLHLTGEGGTPETWSVDVRHGGDSDGEVHARLYRNGVHQASATLPAAFAVPGGTIEVAVSNFGLRRGHYVSHDGSERQLEPDPASAEGRRARLERTNPALSRAVGIASVSVLSVALVLGVPQLVEQLTQLPPIAESIGTFSSPLHLPDWANVSLLVGTLVASTERALRLRYNRILDGGLLDGGDE